MQIKNELQRKNIFHITFEIALVLKGINGLLEVIGGILFFYLTPDKLNKLIFILTQSELAEDPKDVLANWFINLGHSFSISTQYFGAFYLISHGIIKCIIVALLWRKKLWAYPASIFVLILFISYQVYRFTISPSIFLILLTVFDIIIIVLTHIEYKNIKKTK